MKILTENIFKDTNAEDVFNYKELKQFNRGEAVGIYLHKLYGHTMDLIGLLLYYKHPVTIKYNDKQYKLYSKEEWIQTYQDPNDQLKMKTTRHEVLQLYYDKLQQHKSYVRDYRKLDKERDMMANYNIVDEPEIDRIVRPLAKLYDIDVNYDSMVSKTVAYYQILYYLDNDVPYANPAPVIPVDDENMFNINMFKINTDQTIQDLDVEYFGDITYFDDFVNKNKETLDIDYI